MPDVAPIDYTRFPAETADGIAITVRQDSVYGEVYERDHIARQATTVTLATGCTALSAGSDGFDFYGEGVVGETVVILGTTPGARVHVAMPVVGAPMTQDAALDWVDAEAEARGLSAPSGGSSSSAGVHSAGRYGAGHAAVLHAWLGSVSGLAVVVAPEGRGGQRDRDTLTLTVPAEHVAALSHGLGPVHQELMACLASERALNQGPWTGAFTIASGDKPTVTARPKGALASCWEPALTHALDVAGSTGTVSATVALRTRTGAAEVLGELPTRAGNGLYLERGDVGHAHEMDGGSTGWMNVRACEHLTDETVTAPDPYLEWTAFKHRFVLHELPNDGGGSPAIRVEPAREIRNQEALLASAVAEGKARGVDTKVDVTVEGGVARTGVIDLGTSAFAMLESAGTGRRLVVGPARKDDAVVGPAVEIVLPVAHAREAAAVFDIYGGSFLGCFDDPASAVPKGQRATFRLMPSASDDVVLLKGPAGFTGACWATAAWQAVNSFPSELRNSTWSAELTVVP